MYVKDVVSTNKILTIIGSVNIEILTISFAPVGLGLTCRFCTIHELIIFALYNDFRSVISSPYCNV